VTTKGPETADCFLCRYVREPANDAENLVVCRGRKALAVLNRYPYNNGHLLVAPLAHRAGLGDLDDLELLECMHLLARLIEQIGQAMSADGFNVGLNLGKAAGAGLPGHLHWHLVPRWHGDTNFMPVLADVNVVPQSLEALYALLARPGG
jgi:ATP adenylyltransferase